tara:strand:+ start:2526 stop:2816 length:291 start_codon:yes stop_codon:yes gene_type:complete
LWNKTNPSDSLNRIQLAMRYLLLDDGKNVVLIETGIGDHFSDKFKKMFEINQRNFTLSNTLSNLCYYLKYITYITLTYLCFDHAEDVVKRKLLLDY